ncbi:MAG: hypothetical protein DME09_05205 [Candidatus Rokuibacteriota bacterium]|nr:MAG: hypothetical protein DME09_05205 [Candidatus Rokubacteria bacterium]HKN46896.1 hypothetical protein [Candidatus Polarisedimenticolia bacterium]
MTTTRTDEPAFEAAWRLDAGSIGDGPAWAAAARWVREGHRHLTLLLSALAAADAATNLAPSLRRDSEQVLALFDEAERLHRRTIAAEHERERAQREVTLLREQRDRLKREREAVADELTSALNVALTRRRRRRAAAGRSSAHSA